MEPGILRRALADSPAAWFPVDARRAIDLPGAIQDLRRPGAGDPDFVSLHQGYIFQYPQGAEEVPMVQFRRNFVPGGTYFFTVALRDRNCLVLTDHMDLLRSAFREVHRERSFTIDAIVIVPEHIHALMTMPEGDADWGIAPEVFHGMDWGEPP